LRSREKSDGVADETDQWEGADTAEGIGTSGSFVLFAFESDEEGEEEDEDDFNGIGGQPVVEIHVRVGSCERWQYRPRGRESGFLPLVGMTKVMEKTDSSRWSE
jgi:hypothetical protein